MKVVRDGAGDMKATPEREFRHRSIVAGDLDVWVDGFRERFLCFKRDNEVGFNGVKGCCY